MTKRHSRVRVGEFASPAVTLPVALVILVFLFLAFRWLHRRDASACETIFTQTAARLGATIQILRQEAQVGIGDYQIQALSDRAQEEAIKLKTCCILRDQEKLTEQNFLECQYGLQKKEQTLQDLAAAAKQGDEKTANQKLKELLEPPPQAIQGFSTPRTPTNPVPPPSENLLSTTTDQWKSQTTNSLIRNEPEGTNKAKARIATSLPSPAYGPSIAPQVSAPKEVHESIQTAKATSHLRAPKEEAREAIQRAYDKMDTAFDNKDLITHFSFYDKDYIGVLENGEQKSLEEERQERLRVLVNPNLKSSKTITVIEKFFLEGDTATALRKTVMAMSFLNTETRGTSILVTTTRALETWIKRNDRWLTTQSKGLAAEFTIDGRPVSAPE